MRYYVTVNGGGDLVWLSENAGNRISESAIANLRRLRIASGFDYEGLGIAGRSVNRVGELSLEGVQTLIRANGAANHGDITGAVRLVVSQIPVDDHGATGFGLVIAINEGGAFAWNGGTQTYSAVVTVDREARARKLTAVVQDLFQDVMLANCASVQAVLAKHAAAGGTPADFYAAKANFSQRAVAAGRRPGLFSHFAPDLYASLSSIARADEYATMDEGELISLSDLWRDFMTEEMSEHFLSVAEAVKLVRTGYFHDAKPERVAGSGPRPGARRRRENLSADALTELLADPQIVTADGRYLLCIRTNDRAINEVGPLFGWKNEARQSARELRLCTERTYRDSMVTHVRRGIVTPIQLFLKGQE